MRQHCLAESEIPTTVMNSIMIISIALFIVIGLFFIGKKVFISDESAADKSVGYLLIATGTPMVASLSTGWSDFAMSLVDNLFGFQILSGGTEYDRYIQVALGLVLVVLGIYELHKETRQYTLLNMPGLMQHDADSNEILKTLKLSYNQYKEIVLDTTWLIPDIANMRQRDFDKLKNNIEIIERKYCAKDTKKVFSGMAPIPFVIYAGTCHTGNDIKKFAEYNAAQHLYTLLNDKKKYAKLHEEELTATDTAEVVISFSTTVRINATDMAQFNCPCFRVYLQDSHDNAITSQRQLDEYVNTLVAYIEEVCKRNPNVAKIHLLCATQTCFAYQLGIKLSHMQNRIKEVISYHYISSHNPHYPVGICVCGENRGKIYRHGNV